MSRIARWVSNFIRSFSGVYDAKRILSMSEKEWLTWEDPGQMLGHLWANAPLSARKERLFLTGCCRHFIRIFDPEARHALDIAERTADGRATAQELDGVMRPFVERAWEGGWQGRGHQLIRRTDDDGDELHEFMANGGVLDPLASAISAAGYADAVSGYGLCTLEDEQIGVAANILRDIVGNPFRPVALDPTWLTPTVKQLAEAIYEEKAFDRLPILADALEDAGCTHADILAHCRQPGVHAKGCWVLDLVLAKE